MVRALFALVVCFLPSALLANTCLQNPNILISNCDASLRVGLISPTDLTETDAPDLAVTGTYSSADRIGIEGLAVLNGEVKSRRLQGWDGVLIVDRLGNPTVYNARNVAFGGQRFNIKDADDAQRLLEITTDQGASLIQSHLLISDGVLDLRNVSNAPVFYRRLFYMRHNGEFGVWQPDERLTLYDAAVRLQDELQPKMAINLDMGAYDFCQTKDGTDCGRLAVPLDRLTNLLVFFSQTDDES
ncbi:MAG: hypothetical protein AAGJ34_08560 [Pseudomonadota bacterium]